MLPAAALLLFAWASTTSALSTVCFAQGSDTHATASALVQELQRDAAHAAITAETLAKAGNALERAVRFRSAGDEVHAKAADGLALEWAETARDLVRAVDAETNAADLRRRAVDAQARVERSRALVEEAIARSGRLTAELEAAGRPSKERTAVEAHDAPRSTSSGAAGAARGGHPAPPAASASPESKDKGPHVSPGDRP